MSMTLIEHYEVPSGGVSSIVFDEIPDTFTDLYLVTSIRDTSAGFQLLLMDINGSATNRRWRSLFGNGVGGVGSQDETAGNPANMIALVNGATSPALNVIAYTSAQIYLPNYRSSSNKSFSAESTTENNSGENYNFLMAGIWEQTAAITSLTVKTTNSVAEFSSATLYGVLAGSDGIVSVS
jgi:hypothetical protein